MLPGAMDEPSSKEQQPLVQSLQAERGKRSGIMQSTRQLDSKHVETSNTIYKDDRPRKGVMATVKRLITCQSHPVSNLLFLRKCWLLITLLCDCQLPQCEAFRNLSWDAAEIPVVYCLVATLGQGRARQPKNLLDCCRAACSCTLGRLLEWQTQRELLLLQDDACHDIIQ
jgi:hypothetical protein